MKILFALCVLAPLVVGLTGPLDNKDATKLIKSIKGANYKAAVPQALLLDSHSQADVVKDVVNKLVEESSLNVVNFAYKLWKNNGSRLVKDCFPEEFQYILPQFNVTIINKRDNLAIKLGAAVEQSDRVAYGDANDKSSNNVAWKLIPFWSTIRVFYKIFNVNTRMYLKLGTAVDSNQEHTAYGSPVADTRSHHWYLKPIKTDGKILFFIYNRQYNQALKLGRAVDSDGDRQVYSNFRNVTANPDLFGWFIRPL